MSEVENINDIMREYVQGSDHPDLKVYREDLSDNELWHWRIEHFCELGGFRGKRILEVGCGFGWDAVGLALVGGNEVVASDILPSMIDGTKACLQAMEDKGRPLPVSAMQGDICELGLPDASFDGIFSTEAIEHVHDLGSMFDTCRRLLKPGGTAVIVNDSNKYNSAAREHSLSSWDERDNSWEHVEWLRKEVRPVEHAGARPYGVMREDRIRDLAPDLDDSEVRALREATAGLIYADLEPAIERYKRDGSLPSRDEFGWCRNPETGEYSERLLDPFELSQMLRDRGFRVKLRHLFRKFPHRLLNGIGIRALQRQIFKVRPHFVLVATKPG